MHSWGLFILVIMHLNPAGYTDSVSSFPGLLTPVFVACITNVGGLVKLVTCGDVKGRWVDVWRSGTFPKLSLSCSGSTVYCCSLAAPQTYSCVESFKYM